MIAQWAGAPTRCSFSHFSLNPDGILVWRGVDEPVPSLQQTSPNIEYRVELIVLAEDGQGRRNFARIVVKLPASRHQVSLSVMFGVACFLFLISNLVLLTVLFGKRIGRRLFHDALEAWAINVVYTRSNVQNVGWHPSREPTLAPLVDGQ